MIQEIQEACSVCQECWLSTTHVPETAIFFIEDGKKVPAA